MGFVAANVTEPRIIKFFDSWILVGFAPLVVRVDAVKSAPPLPQHALIQDQLTNRRVGLPAAPDATSGTSHDLQYMKLFLTGHDSVQHIFSIAQAIGHGHIKGGAINFNGGLTQAFHRQHFFELKQSPAFSGDPLAGGP